MRVLWQYLRGFSWEMVGVWGRGWGTVNEEGDSYVHCLLFADSSIPYIVAK